MMAPAAALSEENDARATNNMPFHPSFPDTWQVCVENGSIRLQEQEPNDPNNVGQSVEAAQRLRVASDDDSKSEDSQQRVLNERSSFRQEHLLLGGQTFKGELYGTSWIRTSRGWYLPLGNNDNVVVAKPFWPTYRITKSTFGAEGVTPYVCSIDQLSKPSNGHDDKTLVLREYDSSSPFTSKELTKRAGYVFNNPEVPVSGLDASKSTWWTHDEHVWWPKSVAAWDFLGMQLPQRLGCIPLPRKPVMAQAVTLSTEYIKVSFLGYNWFLITIILLEYVLILVGAWAGVRLGWSVGLQLIYVLILLLLSLCELLFVRFILPNGRLWLRLNKIAVFFAVVRGTLQRWDLYSDVGFAVLAFQQRNLLEAPLWIGSTVVCSIVVAVRLLYSFHYVCILSHKVDETSLANVSAPSLMAIFQLLCETINSADGAQARKLSVRAEVWFESFMFLCEDVPQIGLQAAYLFGENAPPACSDCAFGFVVVSFLVSALTALSRGTFRTVMAYRKHVNVSAEVKSENATMERSGNMLNAADESGTTRRSSLGTTVGCPDEKASSEFFC